MKLIEKLKFPMPVIILYWPYGEIREEIYLLGIFKYLFNRNIFRVGKNLLISILKFRLPIKIKIQNLNVFIKYYGIKSKNQKKIIYCYKNNTNLFIKKPMVNSAKRALEIEINAINEFNKIGIETMKQIHSTHKFCYREVRGKNIYNPSLIFEKCVSNYPVVEKVNIVDYFSLINSTNTKLINDDEMISLTISHGDLTVWNTKINDSNPVYIDLEGFKKRRVKNFDIFYYILSYNYFNLRMDSKKILKTLLNFASNHNIQTFYVYLFLLDLLNEKTIENNGYFFIQKIDFISFINKIITQLESKIKNGKK